MGAYSHFVDTRFLKSLQIIVTTVVNSIPAMGTVFILMTLVLCILQIILRERGVE